jgi:hypothetical protein
MVDCRPWDHRPARALGRAFDRVGGLIMRSRSALVEREHDVKRVWWAFRIGMWTLLVAGAALLMVGQFWLGLIVFLSAAVVRIAWGDWSRREQARFDASADWRSGSLKMPNRKECS